MVSVAGRLEDGTIADHLVNWLSPFKERVTVVTGGEEGGAVRRHPERRPHLPRQRRCRHQPLGVHGLLPRGERGDSITYSLQRQEPLATEHQAFRDAINGDASNIVTMREGLHTVRTVEAVLESAREGQVVRLDTAASGE